MEAWGDHVLNQLRPGVRAVFAAGRFLSSEDATAILALPNSAHVERAEESSREVAEALGRHFGRPVRLRLVAETDPGAAHVATSSSAGTRGVATRPGTAAPPGSSSSQPRVARSPHAAGGGGSAGDRGDRPGSMPDEQRPASSARPGSAREADDEEMLDPEDLDPLGEQVPGDAASWAQERLMQMFPGAEEV